ncbi:MAG: hypothetical protein ACKVT2_21180 [Saprospiraceae bacterium]
MKKLLFICSFLFTLITSCTSQNTQNKGISATEQLGVSAVSQFLGTVVRYEKPCKNASEAEAAHCFQLVADSLDSSLNPWRNQPVMLASNAAVLFYLNLTIKERQSLTQINIVIPNESNVRYAYAVSTGMLDTLTGKIPLIERAIDCIKSKDYRTLLAMFNRPVAPAFQEKFIKDMEGFEAHYGTVTDHSPLGFKSYFLTGQPQFGRFYTILVANKQNIEFSIDFSLDPAVQKLSEFRFSHKF